MHREDFMMLNHNVIYFDNGATSLKPTILADALTDYYNNYGVSIHRGDYALSYKAEMLYEQSRDKVKDFIKANSNKEIIFTSGATDSLNKIVFGYFRYYLNKDDEVLITKSEHASNILPWFDLEKAKGIKVKYIPLTSSHELDVVSLQTMINEKTKVISIAQTTNVIGDTRNIKEIVKLAHTNNALVVVDAAQSIPHQKIDVKDMGADFLVFSAHKMCGPTGLGVLYGKEELLEQLKPLNVGGGMNADFLSDKTVTYSDLPNRLEAGTPNIASVIAFGKVIEYLENIGMDNIHNYVFELRHYALRRLKEIKDIVIYNENVDSTIITFNYDGIFSQDLAMYLDKHNICVRAGNHCAKILKDEIGIKNTVRISLYFYNTKEEVDKLIEVLKNENIKNELF